VGKSQDTLAWAVKELAQTHRILGSSALYLTAPVGHKDQADFLNAAICLESSTTAHDLLDELKALEARAGRKVRGHWRERELDLDLLYLLRDSDEQIDHKDAKLQLPHPEIEARAFVLKPLLDLEEELCAGLDRKHLALCLAACADEQDIREYCEDRSWHQATCDP
jgi:2-amino-4-hydroxy-6-hydroxymethyldihydropteridine diphosphokinase